MQFWILTLITQLRKIISEKWRPSCRTHARSLFSKFCITFRHSCSFFANGNFQIVDCTRFSNVDFWFEVNPKKEIAGRLKNVCSFCATLYFSFWSFSIQISTRTKTTLAKNSCECSRQAHLMQMQLHHESIVTLFLFSHVLQFKCVKHELKTIPLNETTNK